MYLKLILLFSHLTHKIYSHASYYMHLVLFHFRPLGLSLCSYRLVNRMSKPLSTHCYIVNAFRQSMVLFPQTIAQCLLRKPRKVKPT